MLQEHQGYLSDPVRLELFTQAIRAVVKPGDRVADLGCGTGILGLLALQAGAGHVCAVDESAMIHVAREALSRAGLGERVSFLHGQSQQVAMGERVDVVVCDHVGYFGFDYGIVDVLRDARHRFLKPGGALIPARIRLQVAAIESGPCYKAVDAWTSATVPAEFRWLRDFSVNASHGVNLAPAELLGEPVELGEIDLCAVDGEFFSWKAELLMQREGLVHGLGGWFDCELSAGVRMTNSPLAEKPIRRAQAFLPIAQPEPVKAGERAAVTLMARPADSLIAWTVTFPASGRSFRHSTWQGMLLSPEDLYRTNPTRVPRPGRAGLARNIVLGYCDGRRTVREIGAAVGREHPDLFPSAAAIARFVAHVLEKDTE